MEIPLKFSLLIIKILNNFVWGLFQYGENIFEDLQELESALDEE